MENGGNGQWSVIIQIHLSVIIQIQGTTQLLTPTFRNQEKWCTSICHHQHFVCQNTSWTKNTCVCKRAIWSSQEALKSKLDQTKQAYILRSKFTMTDMGLLHFFLREAYSRDKEIFATYTENDKRGVKHIHTIHICPLENDDDHHASLQIENVILYRRYVHFPLYILFWMCFSLHWYSDHILSLKRHSLDVISLDSLYFSDNSVGSPLIFIIYTSSLIGELLLETLYLQRGHVEFILSHWSTQAQWKWWPHGSPRSSTPSSYDKRQMQHSCKKYCIC